MTISKRINGLGTVKLNHGKVVGVILTQARTLEAGVDGSETGHLSAERFDAAQRALRADIDRAVKALAADHTIVDEVEIVAQRPGMQAWTLATRKGFGG